MKTHLIWNRTKKWVRERGGNNAVCHQDSSSDEEEIQSRLKFPALPIPEVEQPSQQCSFTLSTEAVTSNVPVTVPYTVIAQN